MITMTSNEIKEGLRKAMSKVDMVDSANGVLVVFKSFFSEMIHEEQFKSNATGLFKQLNYKWKLACEELSKEGFDIPYDSFAHIIRILYPENVVTKAFGWDKLKDNGNALIAVMESIVKQYGTRRGMD